MGLLDDAERKINSADSKAAAEAAERQRLNDELQERAVLEGAELVAEFLSRAGSAGIQPDVELRDKVRRTTWIGGWHLQPHKGGGSSRRIAHRSFSDREEILDDEVVGYAWQIMPFVKDKALILASDGRVVTYETEVIKDTSAQGFVYPDPLPDRFVKEVREYPTYAPLRADFTFSWYEWGEGESMPVAEAMARYLREHSD